MKVTMEDIARAAKVCRATVSLSLRDDAQIPERTRRRIRRIADRLGYSPHPFVSALMATRRHRPARFQATIGFLTHFRTRYGWRKISGAYAEFFQGASAAARTRGYQLEDFWLREPGVTPDRLKAILQARGIQGLILAPLPSDDPTLPPFDWSEFSVLAVGYSVRTPVFHRISHDYFHGMTLALAHCRAKGYRRIGFFLDQGVNSVLFNLWLAAYLAEQKTTPHAEVIEPLLGAGFDDPRYTPWLRRERPDVLVCLDPWELERRGRLPRGLPVVSLNADEAPRPLPGISRDFGIIGAAAAERMIALLHSRERGEPTRAQTILLEGAWINDALLPSV